MGIVASKEQPKTNQNGDNLKRPLLVSPQAANKKTSWFFSIFCCCSKMQTAEIDLEINQEYMSKLINSFLADNWVNDNGSQDEVMSAILTGYNNFYLNEGDQAQLQLETDITKALQSIALPVPDDDGPLLIGSEPGTTFAIWDTFLSDHLHYLDPQFLQDYGRHTASRDNVQQCLIAYFLQKSPHYELLTEKISEKLLINLEKLHSIVIRLLGFEEENNGEQTNELYKLMPHETPKQEINDSAGRSKESSSGGNVSAISLLNPSSVTTEQILKALAEKLYKAILLILRRSTNSNTPPIFTTLKALSIRQSFNPLHRDLMADLADTSGFEDFNEEFDAVDMGKCYLKKNNDNPLLQLLTMLINELQSEVANSQSESYGTMKK